VIYNQTLSIVNTSNIVGAVLHLARIEAAASTQSRPRRSLLRSVTKAVRVTSRFAFAGSLLAFVAGCGNNYRPVLSAINPVGPAAQPQKLAVVISNTSSVANPNAPGLVTFVDFSGDSVLITASIGVNPYYLVLNSSGTTAYTLNGDSSLTNFNVSTSLISSQIFQTTLLPSNGVLPASIFPQNAFTYVSQPNNNPGLAPTTPPTGRNSIAEFAGSPLSLQQELTIDPAFSPIYVTGIPGGPRSFAISQAVNGGPGQVATIENTTNATIDPNPITVGKGPVYGVETADGRRVFIMNQTDGTVSVINAQTNQLDTVPSGSTNPIVVGASPLWADFAPTRNELVVANAGDGINPGSISIISIPLCSATTQITNPNCDPNNPVDALGFGTVLATVPVGVNPRMVGVLQDGTRAYVVNSGNPNIPCGPPTSALPQGNCTVSVVNLTTNTVTATIPLVTAPVTSSTLVANGHPNYIAVTTGTPTGKVYVTSPESGFMTVIRTDIDAVDTSIPLQGKGVSVRVTAP
jgi:YVTN family beta-propeller protein